MDDKIESPERGALSGMPEHAKGLGCTLAVAVLLLGWLIAGAFYMTGLWLSAGINARSTLGGAASMGLLPGIVAGGVAGGFVGSIRRTSVRSGIVFGFFVLLLPLMVAAYLTGERNVMTPILAFVGYGVGGWAIPRIIYRLQDRPAKKKTGSWEDNF